LGSGRLGQGLEIRVGGEAEGDGEEIKQGSWVLGASNEEMNPPYFIYSVEKN